MDTTSNPVLPEHLERGAAAELLTVRQAGAYAPAFGEARIRRLVNNRRLPVVQIGRSVFIDRRDLDQLVEDARQPAAVHPGTNR